MAKASRQKVAQGYRDQIERGERLECGICKQEITSYPTIDHIIPKLRGGPDNPDNYQPAHRLCNQLKSAFLMTELATVMHAALCPNKPEIIKELEELYAPLKPYWSQGYYAFGKLIVETYGLKERR